MLEYSLQIISNRPQGESYMGSSHFNAKFYEAQKALLLKLKNELLNSMKTKFQEDLHVDVDEVIEDGDQAQTYLNQNIQFGLRERELSKLREIEYALARIEDGTYGICEETDEPISKKRLEKMPWTRLSIQAAEEVERENQSFQRVG